jgi:lactate dehydrogenase-like 2-hydroxyacid dehydrogenase
MSKPEILMVAAKLPPSYMEALHGQFTVLDRLHELEPVAFEAAAPRIRAIAANGEAKVPRALMDRLPALKMISVFGVGYDGVDIQAALDKGVTVTHTPEVLNDDVADLAIGLLLSIARRIPQADRFVRDGKWPSGPMPLATKVSGARLGIVGLGRIGSAIARRAESFGMSIAYHARHAKPDCDYPYFATPQALAAEVDFLMVITPGGAATRGLINAQVLQALGPKGFLINVARGSVVDESALVEALTAWRIAGAALDVFENEPHVPEVLWSMDNVVLTPHMASATLQTRTAMANLAFGNLQAFFAGRPALSPVPECR